MAGGRSFIDKNSFRRNFGLRNYGSWEAADAGAE